MVATAASAIHIFTGNNIAPRGDLASRSLCVRLDIDRPDPENRTFKHPDPIGWTDGHRAELLQAFYTILLGNPMLKKPHDEPCKTRFKMWWRVVGSAIEHAAKLNEQAIDFGKLFLDSEEDEEESSSLAEALKAMSQEWLGTFKASDVADLINVNQTNRQSSILRSFLFGDQPAAFNASARGIGKRLKLYIDNPVTFGKDIMTLKAQNKDNSMVFWVQCTPA